MKARIEISEQEEMKRKARMTSRLCFLFAVFDLAILGVLIYELLQLFS